MVQQEITNSVTVNNKGWEQLNSDNGSGEHMAYAIDREFASTYRICSVPTLWQSVNHQIGQESGVSHKDQAHWKYTITLLGRR